MRSRRLGPSEICTGLRPLAPLKPYPGRADRSRYPPSQRSPGATVGAAQRSIDGARLLPLSLAMAAGLLLQCGPCVNASREARLVERGILCRKARPAIDEPADTADGSTEARSHSGEREQIGADDRTPLTDPASRWGSHRRAMQSCVSLLCGGNSTCLSASKSSYTCGREERGNGVIVLQPESDMLRTELSRPGAARE